MYGDSKAYVSNTGSDTVSIIDINNMNVTDIDTGIGPESILPVSNKRTVYVTNRGSDTVSVLDSRSDTWLRISKLEKIPER